MSFFESNFFCFFCMKNMYYMVVSSKNGCFWRFFAMFFMFFFCFNTLLRTQTFEQVPPGSYSFRIYDSLDGLGSLSVWDIVQDHLGFIWVGTEYGVFRYDGERFQSFQLESGLPSTWADLLHVDREGTLWVGTYQGLAKFDGERFLLQEPESGLPPGRITAIAEDVHGLWVGTNSGLYSRNTGGRFDLAQKWPGGDVTSLAVSNDRKSLWVATLHDLLAKVYSFQDGQYIEYSAGRVGRSEPIDAISVDGRGRVWIRTLQNLQILDHQQQRFVDFYPMVPPATQLGHLFTDRQGKLWVTTDRGLYRFEEDHWQTIGANEGLPYTTIRRIFEDREGSLWLASSGLLRMRGRGIWKSHTTAQGLPNNVIWATLRHDNGEYFAGTDSGLARSTSLGWKKVLGTEFMQVRSLVKGKNGDIYLTGAPANILCWNPRTNLVKPIGSGKGLLASKVIFSLVLDHKGMFWAATDGAGLIQGKPQGGDWHFKHIPLPKGGQQERIRYLFEDSQFRLWIPAEHGLNLLEDGTWRHFNTQNGLRANHVVYITETKDGDFWLAYFESLTLGLAHCRYVNGELHIIKHVDSASGLLTGKCYLIGEDANKNIWVGTGVGLNLIHPDGRIDRFTVEDGLVGDDVNAMAFRAEPDGNVWIGTAFGLAFFDASAYQNWSLSQAVVHIIDWQFSGQRYNSSSISPAKIPFSGRTFEVHYSALSYIRENAIEYQVKLVGLEPEWRLVKSLRQRYPGLSPGKYTFAARAHIGQDGWGAEKKISFEILPPFWQSWPFRLIVFMFLGMIVWVLFQWRNVALRRRNAALEEMVAARTQEVEEKAEALTRANEALHNLSLTDPLTGLRNRRYLGVCIPEDLAQVQRVHNNIRHGGRERLSENIDLVFLMVDIDHFKEVNDLYGHEAGDLVLQQMSQILRQATRDTDTVVRWGGEEFLVVARNAARIDSHWLAERIRAQIHETLFDIGSSLTIHKTCSVGFAVFPFEPSSPELLSWEDVVNLSDHCLLTAKRSGRNAWIGLYPSPDADFTKITTFGRGDVPGMIESKHLVLCHSFSEGHLLDWPPVS